MLNRKTLYVCSDNEEDLVYQKEKRKLSIILLKEDVFIKIIKINKEDRLEKLLKETLKSDRAKTQVEGFTKLNLMELTRKHICSHNS